MIYKNDVSHRFVLIKLSRDSTEDASMSRLFHDNEERMEWAEFFRLSR